MSGSPTEAEVQTQWKNAVAVLESIRNYADGTAVALLNTLEQSLEGDYMPPSYVAMSADYRASLSSLVNTGRAAQVVQPMLFEYGKIIRSPYTSAFAIFRDLYDYFVANSMTIKSRNITYGAASAGGSNVGSGTLSRLTADEKNFRLEACTVETKTWKCRGDRNSGTSPFAELFEVYGQEPGIDALERASRGSGLSVTVRAHHAGTGAGGSLLRNGSFSTYSATGTPKFAGWTEASGGSNISQDTANFYRSFPGATTDASLKATGAFKITQPVSEFRSGQLDPNRPYFIRIMVNASIGSATGGTVYLRLGSKTASIAVASLSAGWNELTFTANQDCWFGRFNENGLDVEVEWASASSGYLLVDDMIFAQWDLIDGTYWFLRGGTTPYLIDDVYTCADTGGAPTTGKLQYYLWLSGFGYLPSDIGAPTISDP